ncbi:group III truncated hemoglobin [Immundisolibacter sp.]|uniref:group III truncated hemoglobin n=1 Tax=Immundisolibacter sp. TaxID=1934948 RepID=UPI002B12A3B8|nr:group III truncated hemoglobin [Immundisolibacter sp.]MEA3219203.1 Group 3 truncated hemoglobin ctb [Immundisolibacter sp.]
MTTHRDLAALLGRERITTVVADFYDRVRHDPELGPTFAEVRDWDEVKARIGHFWWIDLGGERYRDDVYNPHTVHRHFGVRPEQVDPWLRLFEATVRDHLPAELAEVWLTRARRMADWVRTELQNPTSNKKQED